MSIFSVRVDIEEFDEELQDVTYLEPWLLLRQFDDLAEAVTFVKSLAEEMGGTIVSE